MSVTARCLARTDQGASLVELAVVMSIIAVLVGVLTPLTGAALDAGRANEAAFFVAHYLRLARQQAVNRTAFAGLVFDRVGERWTFRVCTDENGNGLRRAELSRGPDRCVEGPIDVQALFPGVRVFIDSAIRGPDGEPPSSDPVRFGRSDMASFSPGGSGTAGSVYLRSLRGVQYGVRVAGVTGRTRVLQYDPFARVWREI